MNGVIESGKSQVTACHDNDDYHFNRKESVHYEQEIIKIGLLTNGSRLSPVINQDSVFHLVIVAPVPAEIHSRYMMPNAWKKC